jgi:hypothetical protein
MPVKIEFSTANAAFADGGLAEVVAVLREIADQIETDTCFPEGSYIKDRNGNRIGKMTATIDADEEESE